MRERVSRWINLSIASWFSPYGVVGTLLLAVLFHLAMSYAGYVTGFFQHYVLGLSELAILVTAMVGHSTLLSGKASDVKSSAIIAALPHADNRLMEAEDLPESQLDELKRQVRDIGSIQPP